MRRRGPHEAGDLIQAPGTVYRVGNGRARQKVKEIFDRLGRPKTDSEAEEFVRKKVLGLVVDDFVEPKELLFAEATTIQADLYAVRDEFGDWYIKLYMMNGEVIVVSCHEPSGTLTTWGGLKLGKPRKP